MAVKITFIYICFFTFIANIKAQNMVLNHGFEEYYYCPPTIRYDSLPVKSWVASNLCTPDYYNSCSGDPDFSVPTNYNGYYPSEEGNAYIGIVILADKDGATEHITGILKKPLRRDSIYVVSFYVRFAQYISDYSAKGIGAFLSEENPFIDFRTPDTYFNTLTPACRAQILHVEFLTDTTWVKVEGNYKARGGEKYITLGLFWNDDLKLSKMVDKLHQSYSWHLLTLSSEYLTKVILKPNKLMRLTTGKNNIKLSYYFFDNISVVPAR